MAEEASKYTKFLDNLVPFLDAAPTWFKIWIYVLVFLVFLTAAGMGVFYLMGKEEASAKSSLKYFSIERPRNGEEIPLGESGTWLARGLFPIISDSKRPRVTVEVVKLPDRRPVLQPVPVSDVSRISTVEGVWMWQPLRFSGEGSYEITATGFLNGQSVYRQVAVVCTQKAQAYLRSVQKDREIRGAPDLVLPSRTKIQLPSVQQQLVRLQREFFAKFPGDVQGATDVVTRAFDEIDRALPLFPNDLYLQNVRAYFFKNYAMIMEQLGRPSEAGRALDEAEKMFEAILEQDGRNEGAWNGIGSVAILRGDPKSALYFIDRALEINPRYGEALHDRGIALDMLEKAKKMVPIPKVSEHVSVEN